MNKQFEPEKELLNEMVTVEFPIDKEPPTIRAMYLKIRGQLSCLILDCGIDSYEALDTKIEFDKPLNLFEASLLLNVMQTRSANDLGLTMTNFFIFQKSLIPSVEYWNEVVKPMRVKIARKMEVQKRIATGQPVHAMRSIGKA